MGVEDETLPACDDALSVLEQTPRFWEEKVTHWPQSVMRTGSIPGRRRVVSHTGMVVAVYTVWQPLPSRIILAVSAEGCSVGCGDDSGESLIAVTVDVLSDRKTTLLPLGSNIVALTRMGR